MLRRGPRRLAAPLSWLLVIAVLGGLGLLWSLPPPPVPPPVLPPHPAHPEPAASRAASVIAASAAPPPRHVTRSLAELGLSEASRGLSDFALLFNGIPAAGSELLSLLLKWLQASNGFRLLHLPGLPPRIPASRLAVTTQEELVVQVTETLRREALPVAFHGHVFFTNFTTFDRQSPSYVNLLRDPVDRAISRFHARPSTKLRQNAGSTTMSTADDKALEHCVVNDASDDCGFLDDLSIPYFCGQDSRCGDSNDPWALRQAKANIEKYFPVVGVLEELNATLAVLESKLPLFFTGVRELYFHQLLEPHINWNKKQTQYLKNRIRRKVEKRLALEYELYIWAKQRLMEQYYEVSLRAPVPDEAGLDRIVHSIHKRAHSILSL